MLPTRQGSIRLFRFAGIDVFLHSSWFLVVIYEIYYGSRAYSWFVWNVIECLALFAIVLMHEFGHALACRQVGGQAEQIILWPFGGVAYVAPPQRPGATLWSIAAGPLVNVLLGPPLTVLVFLGRAMQWGAVWPNGFELLTMVCKINWGLLVFNLLPIYPLDGGQILRSLLWFPLGRARSLMAATVIGFAGVALLFLLAVVARSAWVGAIAVFILLNCWRGLMHARVLSRLAKMPRRQGFACPDCRQPPISGPVWRCARCGVPFDPFETQAACPHCGAQFPVTYCPDCGASHPLHEWLAPASTPFPP
jgi:Zn-dependent protease